MLIIKNQKSNYLLTTLFLGLFLIFSSLLSAQQLAQQQEVKEDFSKKELASFIEANKKVTKIQTKSQQKIIKAIKEEGLSVERFNKIITAQQDAKKEVDTAADEMSSVNNVAQGIMKERKVIEEEMVSSIEEEGLDIETYQQIMYAYQQSQKVQQEVNALMEE